MTNETVIVIGVVQRVFNLNHVAAVDEAKLDGFDFLHFMSSLRVAGFDTSGFFPN